MANVNNSTEHIGIRQRTHDGVDRIMDKAASMRDSSKATMADLKVKATVMRENVDGYISENPEKSVLIAAGVGMVAGAIVASAMMRRRQ